MSVRKQKSSNRFAFAANSGMFTFAGIVVYGNLNGIVGYWASVKLITLTGPMGTIGNGWDEILHIACYYYTTAIAKASDAQCYRVNIFS